MDVKVPIMVYLISQITNLPMIGVDMFHYFRGKDNNKKLATRLKKKYGMVIDTMVYIICTINH